MSTGKYKAPRLIQARDLTFNIEYGRYIKPIENKLAGKRNFGKGNYDTVGNKIAKFLKQYTYYTEADHSTFDAYVTKEHLKLTHQFYQSCYYHNKELQHLSKQTLQNKCKSKQGDSYKIHGTRMSGDVDTSLGNSLINYACIKQMLKDLNLKGDCIVNGDDSIIFTNKPIDIEKAKISFATLNLNTKILPSQTRIENVEFCRAKCVLNGNGQWTLMMNPNRIFGILGMTYKCIRSYQKYVLEILAATAIINKNTHVGKMFANLVGSLTFNSFDINNHEFKFLDDALKRTLTRERTNVADICGNFTNSSLYAFPDAMLEFEFKIKRLRTRVAQLLRMPSIGTVDLNNGPICYVTHIDHDLQTISNQECLK